MTLDSDVLAVVLGASGRLGQALLPTLLERRHQLTVIGVSRTKPQHPPPGLRWDLLDLADEHSVHQSTRALARMSEVCSHVIVIDLALDRSSVAAMRRAIGAATHFATTLRDRVEECGRPVTLIVASTTAVLAPLLYQTPYGLAKRRQLHQYVRQRFHGTLFLLPSLVTDATEADGWTRWTYTRAGQTLAQAIDQPAPARGLHIMAPSPCWPHTGSRRAVLAKAGRATWLLARRAGTHANCPHTHRAASRALLALTPAPLRRRVDHHLAPENRTRALARNLNVPISRSAE